MLFFLFLFVNLVQSIPKCPRFKQLNWKPGAWHLPRCGMTFALQPSVYLPPTHPKRHYFVLESLEGYRGVSL